MICIAIITLLEIDRADAIHAGARPDCDGQQTRSAANGLRIFI